MLDRQGYPWPRVTEKAAIEALRQDAKYKPGLKLKLLLCNPKGEVVPDSDAMSPVHAIALDEAGRYPDESSTSAAVANFPWLGQREELVLGLPPSQLAGMLALGFAVAVGMWTAFSGGPRVRPQFQFLGAQRPGR